MMGNYCLDANTLITAWGVVYPIDVFPTLWKNLPNYRQNITLIQPIYNEIDPVSSEERKQLSPRELAKKHPLRIWIEKSGFFATPMQEQEMNFSLDLERKYEIKEKSKGASRNDITLIYYAKAHNKTVVTLESKQPEIPKKKFKYKIPLICQKEDVQCIDFVSFLRFCNIVV